jgi:hypothetical protein
MDQEEIEQRLANAGWDLDGSFSEHLIIGCSGENISLLAHKEAWETDEPLFEIIDHQRLQSYWVREVPTPYQAAKLLEEYGHPPAEEGGDQP